MSEQSNKAAAVNRTSYTGAAVRHSRRRNTVNLYMTIAAAVIAAIGSLLSLNVLFNLSPTGLTVNGVTLYTPEQIQKIGGLVPGQNLVRLNTDYIEKRLTGNLVYIDSVSVLKDYPDGLIINITEAKQSVQIEYDGGYCTISESGRLLEIGETERNKMLPLVTGFELAGYETPEQKADRLDMEERDPYNAPPKPAITAGTPVVSDDDQKTAILFEILEKLDKLSFDKIAKIDLRDRIDIKLAYDGRIQIELGSAVDLDIKLVDIKAVIDTSLPESFEGTLRYNAIDRSISVIPKKTDIPIAVGNHDRRDGEDGGSGMPADSSSAAEGYYDDYGVYHDGTEQQANNGYDQGYGNDYAYDGGAGYDYGYDQNYGYDPNYGYDYTYDYGYDAGQGW